jgi:GxxExxY protein
MSKLIHEELSNLVLGMAFRVHSALGPGLLESAYEGALCIELAHANVFFERQKVFPLVYRNEYAGAYIADLVVENAIILELKSVKALNEVMEAQLINYLRLSGLQVGYLLNFNGLRVQWRRLIYKREE